MKRRTFLHASLSALASAWALGRAPGLSLADASAASPSKGAAKVADHCILLWMNGGPSHIDTFDPKPKAEGASGAIDTAVRGTRIAEHFPQIAEQMSKIALVRGVSSKEGNHQRAQEVAHTGHQPNPTVDAPSIGAWLSRGRTPGTLEIPGYVSLSGPGFGAGFLGRSFDPFVVQKPGDRPQDLEPARALSDARKKARTALLDAMEEDFAKKTGDPKVREKQKLVARARRMAASPQIAAFDVASETEATKKAYGDTDFGRGCLAARRLVEAGVPFVEVTLDGWDTHDDNLRRVKERAAILDPAMASLLRDLEERSLLDRTLVVWMGEFGRTPKISARDGRDHHPAAYTVAFAGGGIRGGVHGATDETGDRVVSGQVSQADVVATMAKAAGLDPATTEISPAGRPIAVSEGGKVIDAILAG
jgi:uncharacterized protein (DUF1501 family)